METKEYSTGSLGLAEQLGCDQEDYGNGVVYKLPPEHGDSWIIDIHPAQGLVVTNAFFQLLEPMIRLYRITKPGLWLFSWDCGDVTILEKGKKTRRFSPGMQLLVNSGQPIQMVFDSAKPIWYTSIFVFDDFLAQYLKGRLQEEGFTSDEAGTWLSPQYNTSDLLMVFEQLKYAVRDAKLPMLYYEGKIGEILALIMRNIQYEGHWKACLQKNRPDHLTYQNIQYIWKVKAELDRNILQPPKMKQLMEIAEMGATKLRRCFKVLYKLTITEYIRQEQMKYAMRLLSHDELSITNIGSKLDYKSASQFTVAFKKVHGFTPSQFRKSFRL